MPAANQTEIDKNLEFFLKDLPELAFYREKFALIRQQRIVDYCDVPLGIDIIGSGALNSEGNGRFGFAIQAAPWDR